MQALLRFPTGRVYEIAIDSDWTGAASLFVLGVFCLIGSAVLAKVRIGSFPVNPIYWHYWIIANAKMAPAVNTPIIRIATPYMVLWIASVVFCSCATILFIVKTHAFFSAPA